MRVAENSWAHLVDVRGARRRALVALIAAALGLLLAHRLPDVPAWAWFAGGIGAAILSSLVKGRRVALAMALTALLLAGGWFTLRVRSFHSELFNARPGDLLTLEAVLTSEPAPTPMPAGALASYLPRDPSWSIEARAVGVVDRGEVLPVEGGVHVLVAGAGRPAVHAGQRVRILGAWQPRRVSMNPGGIELELLAAQDHHAGTVHCSAAEALSIVNPSADSFASTLLSWRARVQHRAHAVLEHAAGDTPAGLMIRSLLLGERDAHLSEITQQFTRLGLLHILSISGFHLTVMAGLTLVVVRAFGERGWLESGALLAALAFYLLAVPVEAPILRSALMLSVLLAADVSGRRYDPATIATWTALGLLVWRPLDLWTLGYQLSCGLTILLLWCGYAAHETIWGPTLIVPGPARRTPRLSRGLAWLNAKVRQGLSAGLLCWGASSPVIAATTGVFSPLAVPAGVVITPLFVLLMWAGYLTLAVGIVIPQVASAAGVVLVRLAELCLWLTGFFDRLPLSSATLPPISMWAGLMAAAGVVAALTLNPRWRRWRWPAVGMGVVLCAGSAFWNTRLGAGVTFRMDTVAVGDGTCHALRAGGDTLLWDCGSLSPSMGLREIPAALRAVGVWRAPRVLVTHPNFDHYGAILDVADSLGVREVFVSVGFGKHVKLHPKGPARAFLDALAARDIIVRELDLGDTLTLGPVTLDILNPPRVNGFAQDNDESLVALAHIPFATGERTLLLTGDIGPPAIERLRAAHPGLHPDVLELPHHGSARPEAIAWVRELNPGFIVQSTGPKRLDDARWNALRLGRVWLCTAREGMIRTAVDTQGRLVTTAHHDPLATTEASTIRASSEQPAATP